MERAGYKIKVFNTINFKKSMHYNPFAYIHSEKDILKLVNTLHLKAAEAASGSAERIDELRKAVELYKGPVFMCGRDQLWLNDIVSQYEVRYIKAADALMRELAKQKDYAGVMEYAVRAHELFPGNGLICYWLIMATYSLSGADMAKKEYFSSNGQTSCS